MVSMKQGRWSTDEIVHRRFNIRGTSVTKASWALKLLGFQVTKSIVDHQLSVLGCQSAHARWRRKQEFCSCGTREAWEAKNN